MNVLVFRLLIILVVLIHITFVSVGEVLEYAVEAPIIILPTYLWFAVYSVLLLSLIGMFFMRKIARHIFLIAIVFSLGLVATQGGIVLNAFDNLLLQIGSGLYGAIISIAYFGNLVWRERLK